jgi:colanic acid/amylovoran biosynthesis glycosyltransferase
MKKVAVVYEKYQHPDRPYLNFWNDGLQFENISIIVFFCSKIYDNSSDEFRKLYCSSRIHLVKRLLLFFVKWPARTIKFILNTEFRKDKIKENLINWAVYAPIITQEPDIVYLIYSSLYPKFDGLLPKSKTIVSFRGSDINVEPWADPDWRDLLIKRLFKEVDCLHFVCKYLHAEAEKMGGRLEKHKIIYPGIDETFFCPSQKPENKVNHKIIITTTARLSWHKGYVFSLQAIKILKDKGFDIEYNLLGGGNLNLYEELVFWRRSLGIEANVNILGKYLSPQEVRDYLGSTDIYIQPSIIEGIPISIMEAMAMELPVIASRVGGISELVMENMTGILVPPANPNALANEIIKLINCESRRKEMGIAGRERIIEKFSIKRELSEWFDLFPSL